MRNLWAEIENLERKLAVDYKKYKKDHPKSEKSPNDPLFVTHKKPLYRGHSLKPMFPGDKALKFDPKRLNKSDGFYGQGVYFSHTPDEAGIWGEHIAEYSPHKPLKLWKEPKTHRGVNIKRKDYLSDLPPEYDGVSFGSGAEGGQQILLRDPSSVKLTKKKV